MPGIPGKGAENTFKIFLAHLVDRVQIKGSTRDVEPENPWLEMQADSFSRNGSLVKISPDHLQVDTQSFRSQPRTGARWLSSEDSPYHSFPDDNDTFRLMDNATWSKNLHGENQINRFVPSKASARKSNLRPNSHTSTWTLQALVAVTIFGAGFFANYSQNTLAVRLKTIYHAAFSTDYTKSTLPVFEKFLTNHHLSIPTFGLSAKALTMHIPLLGRVTADYSTTHPVMQFGGTSGEIVMAAGSGQVTQVEHLSDGDLIEINHGAIGVSLYFDLGSVSVKVGEYVNAGQIIGHLPATANPKLLFSMEKNGQHIDPHDYIQFANSSI